ncbi:efflux transporter outer membrane subunit [Novosphingobium sp.]|uniref:efflux transporter outer membrane subunit n=1 Tax=Novosphingobium sp. TaxID=1874826 RepID=UPI002618AACB|nr:efflux transporter outer membrane subunit [Novosphingobium sp.]
MNLKPPRAAALLPGLLLLAACAAGPDYRAPAPAALAVPESWSVPADQSPQASIARWWEQLNDPLLTRLIDEGRQSNLDLALALTRLRQAREGLIQARSGNLPTITASGSANRNELLAGSGFGGIGIPGAIGRSTTSLSLGADASYQADLFGGRGRSIEAARAAAEASGFDYGTVMLSVSSETATNYLIARLQQAELANARLSLANLDENLQIARWRNQAGLAGSLDVEQARTQRAQTAATIPQLESSLNQSVSRLGVLLGGPPGALRAELAAAAPIPDGPATIAAGLPADVLRQRPDVRAAERQLAAATAQIGVAQAQLYPALTLGGSVSTSASTVGSLLEVISGRVFASLAQTIFDNGRLRSQVRSQRAAADGAFVTYKQTVLGALEDIENALVALSSANQRTSDFRTALEAGINSAIIARIQYRSGLIDFTALLNTENQLISSRTGLAQAHYDRAAAAVQLYTALGGGWDGQVPGSAVPIQPQRETP